MISDNRESGKRLAKGTCILSHFSCFIYGFGVALPSKPLNSIPLYDADSSSALSFVQQKLQDAGVKLEYTPADIACVERLGGRASDLETVRLYIA